MIWINDLNNNKINNENDDIINVDYNLKKEFDFSVKDILDFNKDLLALTQDQSILFITKNNFEKKFEIIEKCLDKIKFLKKIDEEKILVFTYNNYIIIKIIQNCDYNIIQKYDFTNSYLYDFKANWDLLYIKKEISEYKRHTYENFYLNISSFPDYNKTKFYISIKSYNFNKLIFINDNSIFCLANNHIVLYNISQNEFSLVNEIEIDLYSSDCEIIDLNCFYCLNDHKSIILLNKNNLNISKTIKINSNILGFIKIS